MDKNFLISKINEAIKQSKGDPGRNNYLLNRIKQNKEIINSDAKYIKKITGLDVLDKFQIVINPVEKTTKK